MMRRFWPEDRHGYWTLLLLGIVALPFKLILTPFFWVYRKLWPAKESE